MRTDRRLDLLHAPVGLALSVILDKLAGEALLFPLLDPDLLPDLHADEKLPLLEIPSALRKEGIVGYERLKVSGKPEQHFVDISFGDHRLPGAKRYPKGSPYST